MRVVADSLGYYGGELRHPGTEFDIADKSHLGSWMRPVKSVEDAPKRKPAKGDDGGGDNLV